MPKAIIDGVEVEFQEFENNGSYLDYIATTQTIATSAVNSYIEHFDDFTANQKVQVKWASNIKGGAVTATVAFVQEDDKYRAIARVGGSIMGGAAAETLTAAIVAFAAGLGTTLSAPVVIGIGVVGGVVLSVAGDEAFASIYDTIKEWFGHGVAKTNDLTVEVDKNGNVFVNCNSSKYVDSTFLDHKATMTSNMYKCVNHITGFEFSFDKSAHTATIQTQSQETQDKAIKEIFEMPQIQTLTINSQTYNIKNLSNLELRNAIDSIPQVSFLLSNILIKVGEELDLGEKGIYKVKSGDTLSTIAKRNGLVTKDLVRLNPWLCDEGRITFLQNKVLIEGNPLNLKETNHTLYGESGVENILIDANGGDNVFIGGSQKDKMQSKGKGYDKYFANNLDEITDNDGKGEVWFEKMQLTSATKDNNKNDKYFYTNDGGYFEIVSKGLKYTSANGETLIINSPNIKTNFNPDSNAKLRYETLGIKLYEIDKNKPEENNEDEPKFATLSILGDRQIEGNDMKFTIALSRALDKDLVLNLTTRDDDAIAGKDYEAQSIRVTIPAGSIKYTLNIPTIKDGEVENTENFFLDGEVINLSDFTDENGKVYINESATGKGTIVDKDSVSLSISNPTVNEIDGTATFIISLSKPLDEDLYLEVSTNDKSATNPNDYTNNNKTIVINAGATSYSYSVEITDDEDKEDTETFELVVKPSIEAVEKYHLQGSYSATATILDDDDDPNAITIIISDKTVTEGDDSESDADGNAPYSTKLGVKLNRDLNDDEFLILRKHNSKTGEDEFIVFGTLPKGYEQSFLVNGITGDKTVEFSWYGDKIKEEDRKYSVSGVSVFDYSDNLTIKRIKSGTVTIKDDDRDPEDDLPETYDPLVIDLGGDGVKGTSLDYSINFDLNSDGFKEATSWISKNDAFIAIDKNANGIIDNGSELFGDKSVSNTTYGYTNPTAKNGFESLKAFDSNNDSIIDETDKEFANLLLWQDKNSNGISEADEITKLSDMVTSINLNYTNAGGTEISTATLNDGSSVNLQDMYFKVDLKKTDEIIDENQIPFEIKSLPNITATGNLHSLHSAMANNETLATMLNLYLLMDSDTRKANINSLIYEWAGVSDIEPNARTTSMDTRQLIIYEKLQGKPFTWHGSFNDTQIYRSANILKDRYQTFANFVYASIELQTTYSYLNLDFDLLKFDENLKKYSYDFSNLNLQIRTLSENNKLDEISNLTNTIRTALTYKPFAYNLLKENYAQNFSGELLALLFGTHITGTNGNDSLNGTNDADYINGLGGDDRLNGGNGDDIYSFSDNFGKDTIYDVSGNDTIYLDINPDRISLKREFENLIIYTLDNNGNKTQNSITILNFFSINPDIGNGVIETIKFADNSSWNLDEILANAPLKGTNESDKFYLTDNNDTFRALSGDDIIHAGNGNDTIYGDEGNDTLYGDNGNDILYGGIGNDTLSGDNGNDIVFGDSGDDSIYGGDGNDTLIGGSGNDFLQGGEGNDSYIFNGKFDNDEILNFKPNKDEIDTIKFTDLKARDLNFIREFDGKDFSNDLIITTKNGSVRVQNFFDESSVNESYKIDFIKTKDKILTISDIKQILTQKSIYNDEILAFNGQIQINGGFGNDILKASSTGTILNGEMGNDTLISNTGNDRLYGGYGNDKYIYTKGSGSDTIQDNGGNDTLVLKGISQDETKFAKSGKDLIISFTNSDDTITIKDHFKWILGKPNKLENIIFDKDENLQINQIDEFINGRWNKMTYNDLSRKFETNVSESVAPLANSSKGANLANSQICEFANSSKSINSSPFISQNQIDKIIEQVSTYNSDTGFANFAFDDMKGAMNLQIYG